VGSERYVMKELSSVQNKFSVQHTMQRSIAWFIT